MVSHCLAGRGWECGWILRVACPAEAVYVSDPGAGPATLGFPGVGHAGRFGQHQSEIGRDAAADIEQVATGTGDPEVWPLRQGCRPGADE